MLNQALLKPEVSRFIKENLKKDLPALILKGSPFADVSIQELAVQIKGLKVAEKKFPFFYKTGQIVYPPKLNLEQTSSELTAKYKASLINGKHGIDLTGGFGIDTYFISRNFENFFYCELNKELAEIAVHNFKILEAGNIEVYTGDGLNYLENSGRGLDWIYADPARRDDHGGKVYKFEDCEPNLPKHLDMLFRHSKRIMVKSSPILDITAGINELKFVKEVHIVAVKNEVKELLWILEKDHKKEPVIKTINFEKDQVQTFPDTNLVASETAEYGEPEKYLYEPNAAVMKSGLFDSVATQTNTKKLHRHSHLYSSEELQEFPGRKFLITDIQEFKPGYLKKNFKSKKANITTRNFPESVEQIRKKFRIKDGGDLYLFFTTNSRNEKIVILCKKV
jgi:16S rRNA G966 N2-methylase RsmD